MTDSTEAASVSGRSPLKAVFIGGCIAGLLDLFAAFVFYGHGIPKAIAAGLLGRAALQGGDGIWVLGVLLHFTIALAAAAVYYLGSLRWPFLRTNPWVCGAFYGIAVFLVMNLIVLPLSALQSAGPFPLEGLIRGLVIHMLLVGIPIAISVQRFAPASSRAPATPVQCAASGR